MWRWIESAPVTALRRRGAPGGGSFFFFFSFPVRFTFLFFGNKNKKEGVGERLSQSKCQGDGHSILNSKNELKWKAEPAHLAFALPLQNRGSSHE